MSAMDCVEEGGAVPAGFEPMVRPGFVNNCRGVYVNLERRMVAARILPEHLNPLGIAHGGFLATLADTGFGTTIKLTAGSELPPATINLDMDYLSPALPGRWIEVQVQIHKLGRSISVASCDLLDGDKLVARGKGTFINNTRSLHGRVDQK
ncbi:thioesterase superfamily protein [Pseudomonas sp. ATCC 13867]|uniref:PaaI family thioesterase n=1 Tax=Pseudomonas sp. ATCC 13867 TaxID=1294143 RepID=UPI0002C4F737|nr:PaaI family thioesterase [Pseudomonas sp. ATCC 13867]AGI24342.1 thioesterase superfamily protein [Pseudomonas sp. ATCC 13867]RFQ27068.1 PaaI family thioesterase [Pseudomonas sp. ATCC 13867]